MEYNRIISITGLGGLFELISSKSDGAVVRSLDDKTTKFVSSRVHNFSNLETIEVFTTSENINLAEVFEAMKSNSAKKPDSKADSKEIKAYFTAVIPNLDMERVYVSDMKKMLKWYEQLTSNNIEVKKPAEEEAESDTQKAD